MEWFISALKQFTNFEGRSHRTAYWMFALFYFIFYIVAASADYLLNTDVIVTLYGFILLLPSISIGARRLHDTGRTGWWQLIGIIPILGIIVVIVFLVQDSEPGDNSYGPNPKGQPVPA